MRKRVFLALLFIASLLSLVWLASSQFTASKSLTKAEPSTTPSKEAVYAKLASLERGWVKNEGQWDERALFSAPGYFGTTWIAKDGQLVHVAVKGKESWVISERWVGGKAKAITPEEELPTKVSYFVGNDPSKHRSNLPTYRYVSLGEVWSGVEVKLKATQKTVEKLFYIKPGADPSKIVVEVDGAKGLKLSNDGEIIIQTGLGDLKLSKPIAWQEKDGKKLPVEVSYKLLGKNRYSFVVAKADPSLPIVIDPILQSTYLGGSGSDTVNALAIHPQTGEVYVAGATSSTNFPGTLGRTSTDRDAFVARLKSDLTQILQATYLGGSNTEYANALAIHPTTGEVYVAGYTASTNFPNTSGGVQASSGGGSSDAFVARLKSDLTQIPQATYLGGNGGDSAYALVIHPTTGDVYVAGRTFSTNFPNTLGGAQASCGGSGCSSQPDAFVARLSADLTQILQSTYLGGGGSDYANALAISSTGDVYVAGYTNSNDFPGTTGGAQTTCNGCSSGSPAIYDAFVAKLKSDLTQILQSTYLGGSNTDYANALAISSMGDVYVAGYTNSNDFPGTTDGAQTTCNGCSSGSSPSYDVFVARLSINLTAGPILSISPTPTNGTITSSPSGINCGSGGSMCSADFYGTVTLTATPSTGYTFAGWTGDCSSCGTNPTCTITMDANKTCSANFTASSGGGSSGGSGSGSGGSGTGGSGSGSGGGSGSDTGSGSGSSGGSGSGTGGSSGGSGSGSGGSGTGGSGSGSSSGSGSGAVGGTGGGGGGGCSMTGSVSSMAGLWNILVWLSVPAFALARRIRRK